MSVKELLSKLNKDGDNMRDFKKTYAKEDADTQKWVLGIMLEDQNRSNAELARYFSKEETDKWMSDGTKGVLVEDTRLHDDVQVDAPKTGYQVPDQRKPIPLFDINSTNRLERLKAAFQKKWFRENMDVNHALMEIEHSDSVTYLPINRELVCRMCTRCMINTSMMHVSFAKPILNI